jgi:uncharacterized protein YndB with AHSA1/START domain
MSRTVAYMHASPEQVFAALQNPYTYAYWVVGCKRIRYVERDWPQPGAAFHHTIGVGPVATNDETRVVAIQAPRFLELEAHGWPAGQARIQFLVEPHHDSTRVEMIEEPTKGPAAWLHNPVLDAAAHARNTVTLRRLARVAEGRL